MWERDVKGGWTFICQNDVDRELINGMDNANLSIRERRNVFFHAWKYDHERS